MLKNKKVEKKYVTLRDAEAALTKPKGWWACLTCLFLAKRISVFIVNRTHVSANTITVLSFLFGMASVLAFSVGPDFYFAGAILYWVSYLADCVDGTVARLRNSATLIGGYLDANLDCIVNFLAAIALASSYYNEVNNNPLVIYCTVCYCFLFMFFYWTGRYLEAMLIPAKVIDNHTRKGFFKFFDKREMFAHPRHVEACAFIFVIGPASGYVMVGFVIGLCILLGASFLKVGINFARLLVPERYDKLSRHCTKLRSEHLNKIYVYNLNDGLSISALTFILRHQGIGHKIVEVSEDAEIVPSDNEFIIVPFLIDYNYEKFKEIMSQFTKQGLVTGKHFIGVGFKPYCTLLTLNRR